MKDALAWGGAILAIISVAPYVYDIIKQRTKPNIVSWITWTLLTGLATAAAFAAGEWRTGILLLSSSVCTLAVVLLGLRFGTATLSRFDIVCWIGTAVGLALWLIFNSPALAIIASVVIDLIGALPTLRHSWLEPAEETWQTFLISTLAAILTVLSLTAYSIESLLYPLYLIVANSLIVGVVIYRRKRLGISLKQHSVHETLHE